MHRAAASDSSDKRYRALRMPIASSRFAVASAGSPSHTIHFGPVHDRDGHVLDEVLGDETGTKANLVARLGPDEREMLARLAAGARAKPETERHLFANLFRYMQFRALFPQTAGIRRAGSASLDLAYVASGRLDGFWEIGLNIWDMAAGVLLIQESGGLCSDLVGGHDYLESGNIVTASPKLFQHMLKAIRPHVSAELGRS